MTESLNWRGGTSEDSDSDDDEYEMKGKAFHVAPFDMKRVDETAIPLTSQEYLQQVIVQRARLPEVVTAVVPKLPKGNGNNSISALFSEEKITPSEFSPSVEWQQLQISNFSDLRYRVELNREEWADTAKNNLPEKKEDWFQFLFCQHPEMQKVTDRQPYLSTVLSMRNEQMEKLIMHIINFVMEDKITVYQSGTWLFALLTCIEAPICVALIKKLRAFVQKCRKIREKMDYSIEENKKELATQNLFICIICKYFGQHDLSD